MNVAAVDLFCGAGGLTRGLEASGIPVEAGVDLNPDCRYPYVANNDGRFLQANLQAIARRNPERIARLFDPGLDHTILAGCPPCQPFSPLNHGGTSHEHDKWGLISSFERLVEYARPTVVAMENVFEVRNHSVYEEFVETLEENGYHVNDPENRRVYCPDYGIPQKRKRMVLLASKEGPIRLRDPSELGVPQNPTVRDAIGHLPEIEAGEYHEDDQLHQARSLSETNLERVDLSEPGETWELWEEKGREDLLLDCHKKSSGQTYKAPYGRMKPDEPAPTMTTQFYNYGSGRFGHYDTDQNRAISLREGAILQTFPQNYEFVEDWDEMGITTLGELIGNAVPPLLGKHVGQSILSHLEQAEASSQPAEAEV